MTPFGAKTRELRRIKGVTQKQMAKSLNVSPAYLSALENGNRGAPSWNFVQQVIGYFNIIWDEAEELQAIAFSSHPRVVVDTSNQSPQATRFANELAKNIAKLSVEDCVELNEKMEECLKTIGKEK